MLTILCIILAIIITTAEIIHYFERKDLYNRIMSKDIAEYRAAKTKPIKNAIRKNIEKNLEKR